MDLSHIVLLATETATQDAGFVGTLGINAKLFIAQLVNFLVVLFVLWKWVFGPVGGALENRRKKIEASLKKAEEIDERMQAFEKEREVLLAEARKEAGKINQHALVTADKIKNDTVEGARKEAERIMEQAKRTIEAERDEMLKEVRSEIATLTMYATEKIIKERFDQKKDRAFVEEIIKSVK